jgi:phosphatidylglycerol lysyltransferase
LIVVVVFTASLWLLHHELRQYHFRDLSRSLRDLSKGQIALAVLLTLANYGTLTGYDWFSVRQAGRRLAFRRVAFAAFEGFALSQSVSLGGVTGASIRYRLYGNWGLSATEVTAVVIYNTVAFWFGFLAMVGLALAIEPRALSPLVAVDPFVLRIVGGSILALGGGMLVASAIRKRPWKLAYWEIQPPQLGLALCQVGVAMLDWTLVAGVLFALLPHGGMSYLGFLGAFLFAQVAGLVSHVPGGLGVFETTLLVLLGHNAPIAHVLAALVVFRGLYYLLPLLLATLLLIGSELRRRSGGDAAASLSARLAGLVPPVLAAAAFTAGVVLLVSGATPAAAGRLRLLGHFLPLPLVELSHFLGSIVGVLLLLVARGVQRRQKGALWLAVGLMLAGVVMSLLKGFDYEEAAFLLLVIGALWSRRGAFYRRTSLLDERFTSHWTVAIAVALAGSLWLVFFAHKHTAYSSDLWWRFALHADAPRAMRAEVGVVMVVVFAAAARLLRPPRLSREVADGELLRVRAIVASETHTVASLALLGDKAFLFSASGDCAVMYGVRGRSWIALGDPLGSDAEKGELIEAFVELSDRNGGWPVFYEVGPDCAASYRELGLGQFKLGEEASVRLSDFRLEGRARKSLRAAYNQSLRGGLTFAVLPRQTVPLVLAELLEISSNWLACKNSSEKGFSLGFFDADYLLNFPIAVIRKEGTIVAFANVVEGANRQELSVDLMRHRDTAPRGIMDYLFVELMLWGQAAGYAWFNLGMAPLSGLATGPLAPLWDRTGSYLFRHGEHFYNFEGLRAYKDKFDPEWSPRYLVCRADLALPFILADIAVLISGGFTRIVVGHAPRRLRLLRARAG